MKWIYNTIVQKTPLQFRFEFALWTREMVQKIIYDKYGVKLGLSSVSRLLRQIGLTCQRPIFKAWQQNSQQVNNWLKKVFPKIKARATAERADIILLTKLALEVITTAVQPGRRKDRPQ